MTGRFRHLSLRRTFLFCVIVGIFFASIQSMAGTLKASCDDYAYFIKETKPQTCTEYFKGNPVQRKSPVKVYRLNLRTHKKSILEFYTGNDMKGLVGNNDLLCAWSEGVARVITHTCDKFSHNMSVSSPIQQVVLDGLKAYVVSDKLYVLEFNKPTRSMELGQTRTELALHRGYGYLFDCDGVSIIKIDLENLTPVGSYKGFYHARPLVFDGDKGYFPTRKSLDEGELVCLDLMTFKKIDSVPCPEVFRMVIIKDNMAFVVTSSGVYLINLTTKSLLKNIPCYGIEEFYLCGMKGYVTDKHSALKCLDFLNGETQCLSCNVKSFQIREFFGYAITDEKISIIVLRCGKICHEKKIKADRAVVTKEGLFEPEGFVMDLFTPPFYAPIDALCYLINNKDSIIFDWVKAARANARPDALIAWLYTEDEPFYFTDFALIASFNKDEAVPLLIKALEINDPDALAFMYRAFSEGLWGAPKCLPMALFYKS